LQVDVRETIKNYTVQNVLPRDFVHISPDAPLSSVLELAFRTHQEDYPVVESGRLLGFVTRKELIQGIHTKGKEARVSEIMRTDIPAVAITSGLHEVQKLLQKYNTSAAPVKRDGSIVGIVTIDDINRVYLMISEK